MAPIDKDLIDKNILNKKKKNGLIVIMKKFLIISKRFMNKLEKKELKKACSAI